MGGRGGLSGVLSQGHYHHHHLHHYYIYPRQEIALPGGHINNIKKIAVSKSEMEMIKRRFNNELCSGMVKENGRMVNECMCANE